MYRPPLLKPPEIKIGPHFIGPGRKTLIVAEIGGNHGGDPHLARRLIQAAASARADAVKFQAYRCADFLSSLSPYYQELSEEELTFEDLAELMALAKTLGLAAGLTVFDQAGLDLAADSQADFIKISSGDITHSALLAKAASAGRPLFISTGASTEEEVQSALTRLESCRDSLVVLQCASLYPAPPESANLGVMAAWLASGLAAGYSDHVLGQEAALAALRLNARVLEKHFTTDRSLPGGDNAISMEPDELADLSAQAVYWTGRPPEQHQIEPLDPMLIGEARKRPHLMEEAMRGLIRRVVVAEGDLPAGLTLADSHLALKRPPCGDQELAPPDGLPAMIGRTLRLALKDGQPIRIEDLEPEADHG